jgi:hypothetical protein
MSPSACGREEMSVETVLVVTPEVAKSLRSHSHRQSSIIKRASPQRGLARHRCSEASQRQASRIEGLVDKWGGALVPMHERAEGNLATYFLVERVSPRAARALVSEFQHSPGVLSCYIKPEAVLAGGFEPGLYAAFT